MGVGEKDDGRVHHVLTRHRDRLRQRANVTPRTASAPSAREVPYRLGFTTLDREVSDVRAAVTGTLPEWLTGSLLRTAPARFEVGQRSYTHWFDGLAMLHGFVFEQGTVRYSNRFIRSRTWCETQATGRIARSEFMTDPCRTLFGRVMALFDPKPTDNANVNIGVLGDRLVAQTETPMAIRFDPRTLQTEGYLAFGEANRRQLSTAHPHHDGTRTYSYAVHLGRRSAYRLYVDDGVHRRTLATLPVRAPSYLHSFGMSEHHLVLAEFPLRVNPLRLAVSGKPFIFNYRWQPELGTLFTVLDKRSGAVVARAKAPACFGFHHVNAFESDGAVQVDLLAYPDAGIIDRLRLEPLRAGRMASAAATLTRFALPLHDAPSAAVQIRGTPLCATPFELPRFNHLHCAGRPYSRIWGVGQSDAAAFLDTIVKIELSDSRAKVLRWHRAGCYPGEPVFVARPGGLDEDDGVLLSVVLDSATCRSFLLVLDAATLEERARAGLPHHIPFGFHGNHYFDPRRPLALQRSPAR